MAQNISGVGAWVFVRVLCIPMVGGRLSMDGMGLHPDIYSQFCPESEAWETAQHSA
jgi:hypothetical protein